MKSCTVSVPGRTEVAGNHQDHQGGCVITAAIDKRLRIQAAKNSSSEITVQSEGFEPFAISLTEPSWATPQPDEIHTSKALVRGMAAALASRGANISGCNLSVTSTIPEGMGFSSSAAFEVCVGAALRLLAEDSNSSKTSNDPSVGPDNIHTATLPTASPILSPDAANLNPLAISQDALIAERDFFGKPCGMMDQTACALGGVQFLDFSVLDNPQITPVTLPPTWDTYSYLLVDCGESHAHTTNDFARVALDMARVAEFLQLDALGRISLTDYLAVFDSVRGALGDGVALRGLHFFVERELVQRRLAALQANDMPAFVQAAEDSGISSAEYLQNLSVPGPHQEAMVALALARVIMDQLAREHHVERGSARIHGGGFGGTIQVIIPAVIHDEFTERIEAILGSGACLLVKLGGPGILVEES